MQKERFIMRSLLLTAPPFTTGDKSVDTRSDESPKTAQRTADPEE